MTSAKATSLRQAIHQHLLRNGPSFAEDVHADLVARGITTARTPGGVRTSLGGSRWCFQLPDKRWELTTRALTGVVLTVRPRSVLRDNVLWTHSDLEPFDSLLVDGSIPLLTGGTAQPGGGSIRTLTGPCGWLPDVAAGELIGLRWTGTALDVFGVDTPVADRPEDLADVRELFARHRRALRRPWDGSEIGLATVLLSVLREVPELFAQPRPPLSEIFPLAAHELRDTRLYLDRERTTTLTLHVPQRVFRELERRAALLGERLEDHATVLLGGASDRLVIDERPAPVWGYDWYEDDESDAVVRPLRSLP